MESLGKFWPPGQFFSLTYLVQDVFVKKIIKNGFVKIILSKKIFVFIKNSQKVFIKYISLKKSSTKQVLAKNYLYL